MSLLTKGFPRRGSRRQTFRCVLTYAAAIRALFSFMSARFPNQLEAHERAALSAAFLDLSDMLMPPGTFIEDLSNDSRLGQIATLLVCILSAPSAPTAVVNSRIQLRSPDGSAPTTGAEDVALLLPRYHAEVITVTMTRIPTAVGGSPVISCAAPAAASFLADLAKGFSSKIVMLRKSSACECSA